MIAKNTICLWFDKDAEAEARFYAATFPNSEVLEMYFEEDGHLGDIDLAPRWVDEWKHSFLLRVDDKLAGFALISERSTIARKSGVFDVTEFFVLRRFRRQGVGRTIAFDRVRGPWEIRQREENPSAVGEMRRQSDTPPSGVSCFVGAIAPSKTLWQVNA